mmetsp:Transcript_55386/g.120688  ORF Transcript_55386/g.120688 Transcript_55386/m.120688 type:complete len:264 (-) Transcript_55386:332-1123(-)
MALMPPPSRAAVAVAPYAALVLALCSACSGRLPNSHSSLSPPSLACSSLCCTPSSLPLWLTRSREHARAWTPLAESSAPPRWRRRRRRRRRRRWRSSLVEEAEVDHDADEQHEHADDDHHQQLVGEGAPSHALEQLLGAREARVGGGEPPARGLERVSLRLEVAHDGGADGLRLDGHLACAAQRVAAALQPFRRRQEARALCLRLGPLCVARASEELGTRRVLRRTVRACRLIVRAKPRDGRFVLAHLGDERPTRAAGRRGRL